MLAFIIIGEQSQKIANKFAIFIFLKIHRFSLKRKKKSLEQTFQKLEKEKAQLLIDLQKVRQWKLEKAQYSKTVFPTGQMAYVLKDDPEPQADPLYFCQNCMDNGCKINPLIYQGHLLVCQHCLARFPYTFLESLE